MTKVIGMASNEELFDIIVENRNELKSAGGELVFGEIMYEAGMTEVIKEMALHHLRKQGHIKLTEQQEAVFDEARTLYSTLFEMATEEQKEMLTEMFDRLESYAARLEESGFISGYLSGYTYVKHLNY